MINIRTATLNDIKIITDIYNEAVLNTNATFDTEIKSIENRIEWFKNHGEQQPIIVAEENKEIVGWASLSLWSDKCAYNSTSEISVYVHYKHRGKGIGKKLVEIITLEGEKAGLHSILARITSGNDSSMHIHYMFGYELIGTMKEVGFKFNRYHDVYMLQKLLNNRR